MKVLKKTGILLAATLALSCNQGTTTNPTENAETEANAKTETTDNFDWIAGNWKRLNEKAGKETFENWNKISPTEYAGIGFAMQKSDTVSQEKIQLIKANGKWSMFVKTPDEKEPLEFKMLEQKNPSEFTCVNDSLDFPKRVQYWSEGGKLKAKVSNEKMEIPFEFEKIK